MRRNRQGGHWLVPQMIEREHMHHHYRRLNSAKSTFQLNCHGASGRSAGTLKRSKSITDLTFDQRLKRLEKQLADHLILSPTTLPEWNGRLEQTVSKSKRADTFDNSLDLMRRNAKYFTEPQAFTPRVIRKIVQPTSAAPVKRSLTTSRRRCRLAAQIVQSPSPKAPPLTPVRVDDCLTNKLPRMPSDDSAFGKEASSSMTSSTSPLPVSNSMPLNSSDFARWLRKQEEDNNYLQMLCDITADLLQRKLCTNGAVKGIIQQHIRASHKPTTYRWNSTVLMRRLCEDLFIPPESVYDSHYYGSIQQKPATALDDGSPLEQDYSIKDVSIEDLISQLNITTKTIELDKGGKEIPGPMNDSIDDGLPFDPDETRSEDETPPASDRGRAEDDGNHSLPISDLPEAEDDDDDIQSAPVPDPVQRDEDPAKEEERIGSYSDVTDDTADEVEEEFDFD